MYYIIDNTTGEVLAEVKNVENVSRVLEDLTACIPIEQMEVADPYWHGENVPAGSWVA